MANEIISIHVGQAGIGMGAAAWDLLTLQAGLDFQGCKDFSAMKNPQESTSIYQLFTENSKGGYCPRCIFVDTEPNVIDDLVMSRDYKNLFAEEFCVKGNDGASGCFGRGKYHSGKAIHEEVCRAVRRKIEACSKPTATCVYSSICGGTGSGYTPALLEHLTASLEKVTHHCHTLIPGTNISSAPVEPYNVILSLAEALEICDVRFIYDNETCYRMYNEIHQYQNIKTTYYHVNHLIGQVITGITSCSGQGTTLDCDINQFETNLVPFPKVNLISPSLVPLNYRGSKVYHSAYSITADSFLTNHEMSPLDPSKGQFVACCMIYKGNYDYNDVYKAVIDIRKGMGIEFVEWVPTGFKIGLSPIRFVHPDRQGEAYKIPNVSLLKLSNHTAIFDVANNTLEKYNYLLEKRAYTFHFIGEGMEEGEFVDAAEKLEAHIEQLKSAVQFKDGDDDDQDQDDN